MIYKREKKLVVSKIFRTFAIERKYFSGKGNAILQHNILNQLI